MSDNEFILEELGHILDLMRLGEFEEAEAQIEYLMREIEKW